MDDTIKLFASEEKINWFKENKNNYKLLGCISRKQIIFFKYWLFSR